jgi:predicted acyltransferase
MKMNVIAALVVIKERGRVRRKAVARVQIPGLNPGRVLLLMVVLQALITRDTAVVLHQQKTDPEDFE